MTKETFEHLIYLEDYLKRFINKELHDFKNSPPTNNEERQLHNLFKCFGEYLNLNDDYCSDVTTELRYIESQLQHSQRRERAYKQLCRIHGIDTTNVAYNKDSDYR